MKTELKSHIFRIAFFLLILIVPSIWVIASNLPSKNEIIKQASTPKLALRKMKQFYAKDFFENTPIIDSYLNLKQNTLQENPIPNSVVKGKNGWFFLGDAYENTLKDAFGNTDFPKVELLNIKKNIEAMNDYLKSKDIAFQILVAPNKNSIYKENLPYRLTQKKTRFQKLKRFLDKNTHIKIIDPTRNLRSLKSQKTPIYYKKNTHWTSYGAFIAYRQVMDALEKHIPIKPEALSDYELKNHEEYGDLTAMLKMYDPEKSLELYKNNKTFENSISIDPTQPKIRCLNDSKTLKAIVLRDSFSNALIPFFNETFAEVLYLKEYSITKELIEKEKPDVVILEIAERNIGLLASIKSPI